MSRTALIFGVSGQTGSYLAHLLLTEGYKVFGASRDCQINAFENLHRLGVRDQVNFRSVSLLDFRSVMKILNETQPDEVYNLAGQTSVALSFEHPVETFESIAFGTLNILECLRFYGGKIRYFNATSTDCFGHTQTPANEMSPFRPRSPYAMAKAASFWTTASYRDAYGLHATNGILSNHESPLRPSRFVTRKIVLAAMRIAAGSKERLALSDVSIERDWGWAPEYAQAIWKIARHDKADDFVVATGYTCSVHTLVDTAFRYFELDWRDHVDTDKTLMRPSDIPRVALDTAKIRHVLHWRPTVISPGLISTMLDSERRRDLGPVPWQTGPVHDHAPPKLSV